MRLEAVDFKLSTLLSDSLKHVEAQARETNLSHVSVHKSHNSFFKTPRLTHSRVHAYRSTRTR